MAARSASEPGEAGASAASPLRYAALLCVLLFSSGSLLLGGLWVWLPPLLLFGVAPLLELLLAERHEAARPPEAARGLVWQVIPGLMALWVLVLLGVFLWIVARGLPPLPVLAGMVFTVGMSLGGIGLNVAHELGHRPGRLERRVAVGLLVLLHYGHWRVEHTRGHHPRVGTPEDPASARRGESVYGFALRGALRGMRSGFRLEADRLRRAGLSAWSLKNEVLVAWLIQLLLSLLVLGLAGPETLAAWLAASAWAILLTETVNYTQHYGLQRRRLDDGRLEPVHAGLSWCSERALSRVVFLEMPRHADHHAHPARHFPELEHAPNAPRMPLGLLGQIVLALIPWVWFRVMNPRLDRLQLAT